MNGTWTSSDKVVATIVVETSPFEEVDEQVAWCYDNNIHFFYDFYVDKNNDFHFDSLSFHFAKEEDAVLFALKFQ